MMQSGESAHDAEENSFGGRPTPALPHPRGRAAAAAPAAAVEFAIVVGLLFTIFLGMIEIGRAMMVLGALSDAARSGARAGVVPSGDYTGRPPAPQSCCAALDRASLANSPCPVTVTVNGTIVLDDASFNAAVLPGGDVSVTVRIPYSQASWFPAGAGFFFSSDQQLTETVVMRREG